MVPSPFCPFSIDCWIFSGNILVSVSSGKKAGYHKLRGLCYQWQVGIDHSKPLAFYKASWEPGAERKHADAARDTALRRFKLNLLSL